MRHAKDPVSLASADALHLCRILNEKADCQLAQGAGFAVFCGRSP
jgi:hypothetical protein